MACKYTCFFSKSIDLVYLLELISKGFTVIITVGYSDIAEYQFLSYIFAIVGVWYGCISIAIILPSINQSYNIFLNLKKRRYKIVK